MRAAHKFILCRAAQTSAASDKLLTRATETGRDDGRSMECGSRRWVEVDRQHESIEGIDRSDGLGP